MLRVVARAFHLAQDKKFSCRYIYIILHVAIYIRIGALAHIVKLSATKCQLYRSTTAFKFVATS